MNVFRCGRLLGSWCYGGSGLGDKYFAGVVIEYLTGLLSFFTDFLIFSSLVFKLLLHLCQCLKPFFLKLFQLLNPLPNLFFPNNTLHKLLMFFHSLTKSGKWLKYIINLFFFFRPHLLNPSLFLQIKQSPCNNKLLPSYPFSKFIIINTNQIKFHLFLFFSVILIELHFCEKQFSLVIVLCLEVSSFWHVTDYLRGVCARFCCVWGCLIHGQVSALVLCV